MPTPLEKWTDIVVGEYYEDCFYHPCVCIRIDDDEIAGISLVDGSSPRACSIGHCGVRKLTFAEALQWKFYGPVDVEVKPESRWWPDYNPSAWMYCPYTGP